MVVHAVGKADLGEAPDGPLTPAGRRDAAIEQRQFDIVLGRCARQQVELLEDKADTPVANHRKCIVVQYRYFFAGKDIFTRARMADTPRKAATVCSPTRYSLVRARVRISDSDMVGRNNPGCIWLESRASRAFPADGTGVAHA